MNLQEQLDSVRHNASGDIRFWLLLNPNPRLQRDLYELAKNSYYQPIFTETSMAPLLELSPWLVEMDEKGRLSEMYQRNAEQRDSWQGIVIAAPQSCPPEALKDHLLSRMRVQYGDQQKGILHYQLPAVLHYLITEAKADADHWLGLLEAAIWYRPEYAIGTETGWCSYQRQGEAESSSEVEGYPLTEQQQQAFRYQALDKQLLTYLENLSAARELHISVPVQRIIMQLAEREQIAEPQIIKLLQLAMEADPDALLAIRGHCAQLPAAELELQLQRVQQNIDREIIA